MRYLVSTVAALAAFASPVHAQNPLERFAEVRREIVARNSSRALALLDSLSLVVPDHPHLTYLRAHAYGVAGRMDDAADAIRTLMRWDARYAQLALRDSSVVMLQARFPHIDSLATLATRPFETGTVWATITERDLVPEGTAYDAVTQSVLLGSLNKHKIVAIGANGTVSDRVAAGSNGLRSVAGVHVDATRRVLWATSNARYDTPADSTPSALFAFDAPTGAFRARLPAPAGPHFLNDLVTGPDGAVYVTDSRAGRIWRARPGEGELRDFAAIGPLIAPNGITISSDGRVLFVSDVDHLRAHDLTTGQTWRLGLPDSVSVSGIDGLAFVDGSLIAHHPLAFWRIARYQLDADWQRIVSRTLIEASSRDGRTSTTGEVVGNDYVFIGNSQIDRMNQRTLDANTMDPVRVYRVRIGR